MALISVSTFPGNSSPAGRRTAACTQLVIAGRSTPSFPWCSVQTGSLARLPHGTDRDDAAADWAFTTMPTPQAASVP